MNRCLICNREIPADFACIVIMEGEHKYEAVCCSHEGTQEYRDLVAPLSNSKILELINSIEVIESSSDGV